MTNSLNPLQRDEVRSERGEQLLRGLNRVLPLGRIFHPLVRAPNGQHGFPAVPLDKYRVIKPAARTKSITTQLLTHVVPDFQVS